MTLKDKAVITLVSIGIFFVTFISLIIYQIMTVSFQEIEDQRVERNIRRVQAVIEDRFNQVNLKLADWSIWDDTYEYILDHNERYEINNLAEESFKSIGIDEVLFFDKDFRLIKQIGVGKSYIYNMENEVSSYFSKESSLLKVDKEVGYSQGILKTESGLLLYVVQEVYRSDRSGESSGLIIFGRYLDQGMMNSMKNLTQFEAELTMWDEELPQDYQESKARYIEAGKESLVRVLNNQIISGYLVIKDVFGKPVAIVRSDVNRDITMQGRLGMRLLVGILILIGTTIIIIDYWLLVKVVLGKIIQMSNDVDSLRKNPEDKKRLNIIGVNDEVDRLRSDINDMLDSLDREKQKGETLIDLINALVVTIGIDGEVLLINKKGLEMLGYQKDEVVGKNWFQTFIPQESRGETYKLFSELSVENLIENSESENEVLTKDNRKLLIMWRNTVIKGSDGKVISTLSLGEDITMKKEEERRKEEYGKELERLNAAMVGREIKMIELKNEIDRLKIKYEKKVNLKVNEDKDEK
ncbi:MAG TPA: CHASE4 domain-containing protein [Candidatus Methanoperedens sp.]|nr:CHASE4 domain-containing protein [Candidatus Methanoperedens sp.]